MHGRGILHRLALPRIDAGRLLFVRLGIAAALVVSSALAATACTTAVISGRATVDGRPLLWKNRDAPHKDNQVIFLDDGTYRCTVVVNAGQRKAVWMGVNEAGFCIENSVTRDLAEPGAKGPGNGSFMLRALQNCASVEEFEELLERTNGRRSTIANYGVIDGRGGAAMFETRPTQFAKFDANDPDVAPDGYVVRSNFSMTGKNAEKVTDEAGIAELYSGGRYLRGCRLMEQGLADGGLSIQFVLQQCTRDMADADGVPLPGTVNGAPLPPPSRIDTASTISRRTSVSAVVFHGVRPGEDPQLATMWVLMGEPAFSIAVPCWVAAGKVAEELQGEKKSELCSAVRRLRKAGYAEAASSEEDEKPAELLVAGLLPEILARTVPVETEFLDRVEEHLKAWRRDGADAQQMAEVHRAACQQALAEIERLVEHADELNEAEALAAES